MKALSDATIGLLKPVKLGQHDRLSLKLDADKGGKHFVAQVFAAQSNGHANWPSWQATTGWLERVPERRKIITANGHEAWLLAATDYTAAVVQAVWGSTPEAEGGRLKVDAPAKTMLDYLLASTDRGDEVALSYATFRTVLEDSLKDYRQAAKTPTADFPEGGDPALVAASMERGKRLQRMAMPPEALGLEQHQDLPLEPYQLVGTWLSMRSEGYNLFMDPGTGKTAVVIARIMNECRKVREREGRPYRALVVCPKAVRVNWEREFARFCTKPGEVTGIRGGVYARASGMIECLVDRGQDYSVCVMSYEALKGTWDFLEHVEWDLGVLDEAHYAKRPMTARSQYTRKLRDKCRRRMGLTGTPVSNTPLDLYALFEFLGEGWSGFQSWKAFKDFYGVFEDTGDGYSKLVSIQNLPFMKERLTRTAFCVTLEEALPWLPDKVQDAMECGMSSAQQAAYDMVAKELMAEADGDLAEPGVNKAITVQNILTRLLRLAQIASGYIVWDRQTDETTGLESAPARVEFFKENPKLEALVEMLREKGPNDKTIVWSCFRPPIQQISERLTAEGIKHVIYHGSCSDEERLEAERAFNCDPDVKVFVGNQGAGGVGLNLLGYPPHGGEGVATNCSHHVFYVCDWSYVKRQQAGQRSHRRGTRVQVRETDLFVPETLDEDIRMRVMEKKMMAMDVADIRDILASVIKQLSGKRGGQEENE